MKPTVLISSASFGRLSGDALELLARAKVKVVHNPFGRTPTEDEMVGLIQGIDGVIVGTEPISARVLERADRLKVIVRRGTGLDNIDLAIARRKGVQVFNTPGTVEDSVAELTMGLILALARQLTVLDKALKNNRWWKLPGIELAGKILGLVGLGRIGQAVAERAKAFKMRVIYYSRTRRFDLEERLGVTFMRLDQLLQESDFVTLHVPLSKETTGLIGERELALMKPAAFLINTARGAVIDEEALYRFLEEGRIAGAALDVFKQEPLRDSRLQKLDNVILTPHVGTYTKEAAQKMDLKAAELVLKVLQP
ncbi:phosphoglycerate dehydrogenase [Desulfofundulus salinus]|uniref:Hydroxyacid dehydrogenase n=1 Tax=Desulfofundulus salinus TaxID=2419843 RepID=A0A494WUD4_9FIRM|nr:phosphoglycerate dehydrogenase [Desulfofundulus salinum]RKO67029.1 hydroxyacid dehydrogenase [Desulfofundulus salinum]